MDLYKMTAKDLSLMLREKKCSATEISQSVFNRIKKVENKVNSYITLCEEDAIKKAEYVDKKIANGDKIDNLAGIPIAIKDNICTKDLLTTAGSKMLENFVPPYDATVIDKLKNNDVIITGKLNLDEFAMGSSCENSYYKKTKNPHNLDYVPGGSSGGSASCVAAGEAILSLGSDTGGSVRLPASYCGVVGLKPTYGSISRYGLIAFASSLDQIGPMGRSVYDVAMLFDSIRGHDKFDATSIASNSNNFNNNKRDIKSITIGIPKEYFGDGVSPAIKKSVMDSIDILKKQGANIKEVSLESTSYALSAYYIISSAEASSNLARFDGVKYGYRTKNFTNLSELYENTRNEGFGEEVKRRILLGTFVLSSGYYDAYYMRAKLLQKKIQNEFNEIFKTCDVLITPTATDTAFKIGEKNDNPIKMYANDICTVTVNIAGIPAISIPCGKDINNMPIGMQIIGPKFSENLLFSVASEYENIVGGFNHIPDTV